MYYLFLYSTTSNLLGSLQCLRHPLYEPLTSTTLLIIETKISFTTNYIRAAWLGSCCLRIICRRTGMVQCSHFHGLTMTTFLDANHSASHVSTSHILFVLVYFSSLSILKLFTNRSTADLRRKQCVRTPGLT